MIFISSEDQENTIFTYHYESFKFKHMPFWLSYAPATFHMCMMNIFFYMLKEIVEVFTDDFSMVGDTFEDSLANFGKVIYWYEETNMA